MSTPSKKVMLAIPGKTFGSPFVASLVQTLFAVWQSGKYDISLSFGYSSFVPFARMKTLGLDVLRGADQKPFNGAEYDVFITIDSDIVFNAQQLCDIIDATDNYPVVSGLYKMANGKNFACVKEWDTENFVKNGTFTFMSPSDITTIDTDTDRYIEVAYNGMGFFAARKEVLDAIKYPYFWAPLQQIGDLTDMCSEDVAFCKNIQEAGYKIMVDTKVIVGHEKTFVI